MESSPNNGDITGLGIYETTSETIISHLRSPDLGHGCERSQRTRSGLLMVRGEAKNQPLVGPMMKILRYTIVNPHCFSCLNPGVLFACLELKQPSL